MIRIELPSALNIDNVTKFVARLDRLPSNEPLKLNFGTECHMPPFSMLLLGAKIRRIRTKRPEQIIEPENCSNHQYAAHMGFFDLCGIDYGLQVGEAQGSDRCIPITRLSRKDLCETAEDRFSEVGDLVQRHADKIAELISRDAFRDGDMFNALSYSIREILRNVFEHSECDEAYYCGQYWPRSGRVEMSICDLGIGIKEGLGTNPNYRFKTDKLAIEMALLPGVSGKTHLPRQSDVWHNSGYGLYMVNRLARNGGNFVIASGETAILLSQKTKRNLHTAFPGTALRMSLDTLQIGDVACRLSEFRKDADKITSELSNPRTRPPSAMSLLLRRDYQS